MEEEEILISPPVPKEKVNTRLDKWIADSFPKLSRAKVSSLINAGNLTFKGEPTLYSSKRVKEGEVFCLTVPPEPPSVLLPQKQDLNILYEDDDIIIVNKQAGVVVHPGAGNFTDTLVNGLLYHAGENLSDNAGTDRPGIVHRIDKDTSGVLVIAKNDAAHRFLAAKFKVHDITRVYKAVVWGIPNPVNGTITGNIGRSPANRQKMAILKDGGRNAVTHYRTLQVLAGGAASLIECKLETGRTHQIRVHLTSIGNPLVGDATYGFDKRFSKVPMSDSVKQALFSFPRQALHAEVLGFIHPVTGKEVIFSAPLPQDMQTLLDALQVIAKP